MSRSSPRAAGAPRCPFLPALTLFLFQAEWQRGTGVPGPSSSEVGTLGPHPTEVRVRGMELFPGRSWGRLLSSDSGTGLLGGMVQSEPIS